MNITAFDMAQRYVGVREFDGMRSHPLIQWWLSRTSDSPATHDFLGDETPWCSAFVNGIAWELNIQRSRSLAARSWLHMGVPVDIDHASIGFDVVILKRGDGPQPGADVINAPGHVGFYAGHDPERIHILGGNQSDAVTIASFPRARVLGIRRLA